MINPYILNRGKNIPLYMSMCVNLYMYCIVLILLLFSHSDLSDSYDPMDYSPPGFSLHGISKVRILEWVAISFTNVSVLFLTNKYLPIS